MPTLMLAGCLDGRHEREKKTMAEELTLLHLSRVAASFRLHLICEFGQLPEQVQAEYTPLACSEGPWLKQVFPSCSGALLDMSG